jgi:DNA-binding IscR family transcriptional regulator
MTPLATERQTRILDLLRKHGTLSIQKLAEALDVSNMTIHRDLDKLAAAGLVNKVHGGASLSQAAPEIPKVDLCALCGKPISGRTTFIIRLPGNSQQKACCPHCGLVLLESHPEATAAFVMDYLHGTIISAAHATYLLSSDLTICCIPTILCFASANDAVRFQRGFGGSLADIETAHQWISNSTHSPHHST